MAEWHRNSKHREEVDNGKQEQIWSAMVKRGRTSDA